MAGSALPTLAPARAQRPTRTGALGRLVPNANAIRTRLLAVVTVRRALVATHFSRNETLNDQHRGLHRKLSTFGGPNKVWCGGFKAILRCWALARRGYSRRLPRQCGMHASRRASAFVSGSSAAIMRRSCAQEELVAGVHTQRNWLLPPRPLANGARNPLVDSARRRVVEPTSTRLACAQAGPRGHGRAR